MSKPAIMLIHGLWMSPHTWRGWIDRYTRLGHRVHAPAWPGVAELNEAHDPDRAPSDISVTEITGHYEAYVRRLPEPPIIMGHSLGGLVTQILLDRGYGRAGVAIHSAQPRGVLRLPLSSIRAAWPVLGNPRNLRRTVTLTDRQFHYAFANTVTFEQAAAERRRYAIAAPGRPLFQAGLANFNPWAATKVNWRNHDRAPLLLVGGAADRIVPAAITRENHRRYRTRAITEYKEYPGRDHLTCNHPGWEIVADHALTWALAH